MLIPCIYLASPPGSGSYSHRHTAQSSSTDTHCHPPTPISPYIGTVCTSIYTKHPSTYLSVNNPINLSRFPSRSGVSSGDLCHAGLPLRLFLFSYELPFPDRRAFSPSYDRSSPFFDATIPVGGFDCTLVLEGCTLTIDALL